MTVGMMEDFAVVFGAFFGGVEDCVCFGDFYEAFARVGVGGVAVWVVRFGEGVEGSFEGERLAWKELR
jgi:hypothetical protein